MGRIKMLWEKSIATLKNDGIRAFFMKAVHYIKKSYLCQSRFRCI